MPAPHLTRLDVPDPRAVVLLLHGGRPSSERLVDGRSASWRRMGALQRTIARDARECGASSWLVRYRARGWNGGHGPVGDARAALEEVRRVAGAVPVVLLGHSMGARVAVHVADDPSVAGVLALAPWWTAEDPVATLAGRRLVAAHGRRDRITSFRATGAYVARARATGVDAELIDMGARGHYLLSGAARWHRMVRESLAAILDDLAATGRPGDRSS